jgi:glycerol-3-phosphate dehydrogenase
MDGIAKINRLLHEKAKGSVIAVEERGSVVLKGKVGQWDDLVGAGYLVAGSRAFKKGRYKGLVSDIECEGVEVPKMRLPALRDDALQGLAPDVLIIGGGVVGCAIARELSRFKLDVLLVEKEHDVALHASGRNDGMVHPGADLRKGSLKRKYNSRGNALYAKLCGELGVEFTRNGQYLCFPKWLMPILYFTLPYWRLMGIPVKVLGRKALEASEPNLSQSLRSALFFPSSGCVSPYGITIALAENAVSNGARLSLDTAAISMETENGRIVSVETNRGTVKPKAVVNAAGVFSEDVAKMAGDRFFSIHPRIGVEAILDKKFSDSLVHAVASAFGHSSAHTKGGGIVRTTSGNVLVGPDAKETPNKESFETNLSSVMNVFKKQRLVCPSLSEGQIITYFSGIRAAAFTEDFIVQKGAYAINLVHAAGIQSPGLTAAPAIAEDVAKLAVGILGDAEPNPSFNGNRVPIVQAAKLDLEKRNALIKENPDYGLIVCRCEEVSKGEILDALRRNVPCRTMDGIKRRVRPGMGRCQGGFCGPLIASIIAEEMGIPLSKVKKSGEGSELLMGSAKEGCDADAAEL